MSNEEQNEMRSEEQEEQHVAVGGVQYRRAGCLLIPFLPVKAAGLLIVTTTKVVFDPILHYKLVTRKLTIEADDISEAEVSGSNMELSVLDLVNIGKKITVRLKTGKEYVFRSTTAELLADAINYVVGQRRG